MRLPERMQDQLRLPVRREGEIDDLDLDATADRSVTVVEWGAGVAEQLSDDWLHIAISAGATGTDSRLVSVVPHGPRWAAVGLRSALEKAAG